MTLRLEPPERLQKALRRLELEPKPSALRQLLPEQEHLPLLSRHLRPRKQSHRRPERPLALGEQQASAEQVAPV